MLTWKFVFQFKTPKIERYCAWFDDLKCNASYFCMINVSLSCENDFAKVESVKYRGN